MRAFFTAIAFAVALSALTFTGCGQPAHKDPQIKDKPPEDVKPATPGGVGGPQKGTPGAKPD